MGGRGGGVLCGIAQHEHGDGHFRLRQRELPARGGRIEVHHPKAAHAAGGGFEHHVGGDDGGIHLARGRIVIAGAPPTGGAVIGNEQRGGRTKAALRTRIDLGERPTRNGIHALGLLIARGGRKPPRLQDRAERILRNGLRLELTAGIAFLHEL